MPDKPTKEFWNKHYPEIKKQNPELSEERISKIVADIWYHKMGKKTKSKYEKIRKHREGKLEKSSDEILDTQHIIEDLDEFENIKKKSKHITAAVEKMKAEDQQALKKKKKKKTKEDDDLEKAIHFIEIDVEADIPTGFESLEIR